MKRTIIIAATLMLGMSSPLAALAAADGASGGANPANPKPNAKTDIRTGLNSGVGRGGVDNGAAGNLPSGMYGDRSRWSSRTFCTNGGDYVSGASGCSASPR